VPVEAATTTRDMGVAGVDEFVLMFTQR
jgi:hypothetical protein